MARQKLEPTTTKDMVFNRVTLSDYEADLSASLAGLMVLNAELPARATCRQLQIFWAIAAANALGERATLTSLRNASGETSKGEKLIGQQINKSFQMFLPPTPRDPSALGWIKQEPDANDGRLKYLVLTEEGLRIAKAIGDAMRGDR